MVSLGLWLWCFYLFNNQIADTVINLDFERYLFSLEFAEAVPYDELLVRFAAAGLIEPCRQNH